MLVGCLMPASQKWRGSNVFRMIQSFVFENVVRYPPPTRERLVM